MHPKLQRCGTLNDAVKIAGQALKWNLVVSLLLIPIFIVVGALVASGGVEPQALMMGLLLTAVAFVFSLPMVGAIRLLLKEQSGSQDLCLLLRAFQSDARSDQFRAWLKAALGHRFKLSGIRPPRERVSPVARIFSPLFTGLRYLGSRQFEMEAPDHNWMARLLATFTQSRFVFIDVRDVTTHVLEEIKLAWSVFGRERTVFVIDDQRPETEWRRVIAEYIGDADARPEGFAILVWPTGSTPSPEAFTSAVQGIVDRIPAGVVTVPEAAVESVFLRVGEAAWDSEALERPVPLIVTSILVTTGLSGLLTFLVPNADKVVSIGLALILQFLFWRAWNRARRQQSFARMVNPGYAASGGRLWGSASLMAGGIAFIGLLFLSMLAAFEAVKGQARKAQATTILYALRSAAQSYAVEYGRVPWEDSPTSGDPVMDLATAEEFLATLRAEGDASRNPRQVRFLDFSAADLQKRLVDEWGTPLKLAVDADGDELIRLPFKPEPIRAILVGVSAGRDRQWGTADDRVID